MLGVIAQDDLTDDTLVVKLLVHEKGEWMLTKHGQRLVPGMQRLLHEIIQNRFDAFIASWTARGMAKRDSDEVVPWSGFLTLWIAVTQLWSLSLSTSPL